MTLSSPCRAPHEYARNGDVDLAYQLIGEGDRDVLLLSGATMPMDALDQPFSAPSSPVPVAGPPRPRQGSNLRLTV